MLETEVTELRYSVLSNSPRVQHWQHPASGKCCIFIYFILSSHHFDFSSADGLFENISFTFQVFIVFFQDLSDADL